MLEEAQAVLTQEIQNLQEENPEAAAQLRAESHRHIPEIVEDLAKKAAERMSEEIADALGEDDSSRAEYRETIRKVILSALKYGMGVLKGPLVSTKTVKRWERKGVPVKGDDGRSLIDEAGKPVLEQRWVPVSVQQHQPYYEFVPIWDFYPDAGSPLSIYDGRGCFQRRVVTRHELLTEIAKRPRFDREAIQEYVDSLPGGDVTWRTWEQTLQVMGDNDGSTTGTSSSSGTNVSSTEGRYEVIEYWGFVSGTELIDAGMELPEGKEKSEFRANVWMLGPVVIRAVLHPFDGITLPYYAFYFDKDETTIYGEGLPAVMRDNQSVINALIRAGVDNAAMSSLPMGEVNIDLTEPGQDPTRWNAGKFLLRRGKAEEAAVPAVRWHVVPSNSPELLNLAKFFFELVDEDTTVPRYLGGEGTRVGGAGATASGLSMLMGAANISLSELVKQFDDTITSPFISGMYHWFMQFHTDDSIKGDMQVKARGSTALMAKEQRAQAILQVLDRSANPNDEIIVDRVEAWRELNKAIDLPKQIVRENDEIERRKAEDAQQAEAQAMAHGMGQQIAEEVKFLGEQVGQIAAVVGELQAQQPTGGQQL